MDSMVQVQLFIELLNSYLFFLEKGNEEVSVSLVNQLLEKVREELQNLEKNDESQQISKHFLNTIEHIKTKLASSPDLYKGIELDKKE